MLQNASLSKSYQTNRYFFQTMSCNIYINACKRVVAGAINGLKEWIQIYLYGIFFKMLSII